jgi:hypothetical protein
MAIALRSQHITNMYTPIELVTTNLEGVYVVGGGVTDHGYLHGLGDNDHPQYMQISRSTSLITGTGNSGDFLGTGATVSLMFTSNSHDLIASEHSTDFAAYDHTHTLGSYLTTAAASDHSHGSVYTASLSLGTDIEVQSAATGLTLLYPKFQTTQSGVFPIAAGNGNTSGSGWIERWNGPLSFSNTNGISFGLNSDGDVMTAQMEYPDQVGILGIWDGVSSLQTNSSLQFADANGLSFRLNGSTITGSYTVPGNTVFSNSNNITFGLAGSTVTAIAGFNQTTQTQNLHNVTLGGNTSGTMAQISSGTMTIAGGTNVTLSQNGNAVTISANNPLNVGLSGNTSGTMSAISTGNIYFAGGNNITLSQNGSSITISGPNAGAAQTSIGGIAGSNTTFTSGTVYVSGQNNITVGSFASSNSQYIRLSVGNYLTTAAQVSHTHGSNVSTRSTSGYDVKFSSSSNGLTMAVPAYSTAFIGTASTSVFAKTGFTTVSTSGTDIKGTLNTLGLNLAVPKYITTAITGGGSLSLSLSLLSGSVSNASNGMSLSLTGPVVSDFLNSTQVGTVYFMDGSLHSWSSSVSGASTSIYLV